MKAPCPQDDWLSVSDDQRAIFLANPALDRHHSMDRSSSSGVLSAGALALAGILGEGNDSV